jgi:glycerol uptake facilitator-like aquaporin
MIASPRLAVPGLMVMAMIYTFGAVSGAHITDAAGIRA